MCFLFEMNEGNSADENYHYYLKLFLLIIQIVLLLQDTVILLYLKSLKEWLGFHDLICIFKRQDINSFLAYNIVVAELLFCSFFYSSFPFPFQLHSSIKSKLCDFLPKIFPFLYDLMKLLRFHHWLDLLLLFIFYSIRKVSIWSTAFQIYFMTFLI